MSTFTRTAQKSSGGTGVVCQIGMLNFTVDLATVGRPNKRDDTAFKYVCPDPRHASPHRVDQRYICSEGSDAARVAVAEYLRSSYAYDAVREFTSGDMLADLLADGVLQAMDEAGHHSDQDDLPGYRTGELHKARNTTVGDETSPLVTAAADEILAAKVGDIESGQISFRVHEAWQIDVATLPGKGAYRLRPALTKKRTVRSQDMEVYAAIVELLRSAPHLALVGSMRVRDARATYRLGLWGSQLVLNEVILPSDLADRDQVDTVVADEAVAQLRILVESCMEDFDESVHRFDARTAVEALIERNRAIEAGEIKAPAEAEPVALEDDGGQVIDLTAMLAQMVDASKRAA